VVDMAEMTTAIIEMNTISHAHRVILMQLDMHIVANASYKIIIELKTFFLHLNNASFSSRIKNSKNWLKTFLMRRRA